MYNTILPLCKQMREEVNASNKMISDFKKLICQNEEAILMRATRMDIEEIKKLLAESYLRVQAFDSASKEIKSLIQSNWDKMQEITASSQQAIKSDLKQIIQQECSVQSKQVTEQFLAKIDFEKIQKQISQLRLQIAQKANQNDLIQFQEHKTNKISTEKLVRFMNLIQRQVVQLTLNTLQFMKTFHPNLQSQNMRNNEIEMSITKLEHVFNWINMSSFGNHLKNSKDIGGISNEFSPLAKATEGKDDYQELEKKRLSPMSPTNKTMINYREKISIKKERYGSKVNSRKSGHLKPLLDSVHEFKFTRNADSSKNLSASVTQVVDNASS